MTNRSDHYEHPKISIRSYSRNKRIELGVNLSRLKPIYLDMNFWITLLKNQTNLDSEGLKLEELLRKNVSEGKIFCPISMATFEELMKQADSNTRQKTAELIDALSLGVCIIEEPLRYNTEIAYFIKKHTDQNLHDLSHLMWTKSCFVLGEFYATNPALDLESELVFQKLCFDRMWNMTLVESIDNFLNDGIPKRDFANLASRLNADSRKHQEEISSYQKAYKIEMEGIVDATGKVCVDIFNDMAHQREIDVPNLTNAERKENERAWKNLLAASLKKNKSQDILRMIHINTCLHASFRWDKERNISPNDLYDFMHASAALGYCKAFFTDRGLASLITQSNIALDKKYDCFTSAKIKDAIGYLENLS